MSQWLPLCRSPCAPVLEACGVSWRDEEDKGQRLVRVVKAQVPWEGREALSLEATTLPRGVLRPFSRCQCLWDTVSPPLFPPPRIPFSVLTWNFGLSFWARLSCPVLSVWALKGPQGTVLKQGVKAVRCAVWQVIRSYLWSTDSVQETRTEL